MVASEGPLKAPQPCRGLAATSSVELPGPPSVALGASRGGTTALLFFQVKENNYRGHGDSVDQLCWHPSNPDLFVTASGDKTIRIWDVRTTKCIATVNTKGGSLPLWGSVMQPCHWYCRLEGSLLTAFSSVSHSDSFSWCKEQQ